MSNEKQKFSVAIQSDLYKNLINNTLGDKDVARKFVADISSVVSANNQLQECSAPSILSAGLVAQSLNLPLSSTLGFAYIVPYNSRDGKVAQFQIGWKGLVQLAQRSGQFERLGVREVHEGEYVGQDEFGDDMFNFSHDFDNNKVVGYYAYFKLLNGFKKTLYWTVDQCKVHAKKYSKSFGTGKSTDLWTNNFDSMASKTVLKLLLNRYAPLSIEMQKAIKYDQSAIDSDGNPIYVDNEKDAPKPKKSNVNNVIEEVDIKEEESAEEYDFDSIFALEDTQI